MDQHDGIRRRSGVFYTAAQQQDIQDGQDANLRHNQALRDVLTAFIHEDEFALLDIGCGCGRVAQIVRDVFPESRISGVDISADQIG